MQNWILGLMALAYVIFAIFVVWCFWDETRQQDQKFYDLLGTKCDKKI
ncbi:MAG: hypothetical protein ABFQ53_00390 [Patescibacteria group bacterium]